MESDLSLPPTARVGDNSVILCCGGKGCPELSIEGDKAFIKFDDGSVSPPLQFGEVEMMPQALSVLRAQRGDS